MASPPGFAIAGEIDEGTYAALVGQLDALAAGLAEIHVDLAGVLYCDLAGLRAIIRLAGADIGAGAPASRRVVLHHIPPQLLTVLRIVGWDSIPGLLIDHRTAAPRRSRPT